MTEREVESRGPLEWQFYPDNGRHYVLYSPWAIDALRQDGQSYGDGTRGTAPYRLTLPTFAGCDSLMEAKSKAQALQDVLDGVPDQARADIRAEALAEVVARLRSMVNSWGIDGYETGDLERAIATVREMGEK